MSETTETQEEVAATPTEQSGGQLGTALMALSALVIVVLGGGLLIGLWQSIEDETPRDAEIEFVDDYDDYDDYDDGEDEDRSDTDEEDPRFDEECDIDPSDAEERFAPDCDDSNRNRGDDGRNDDRPGLFPDE